MEEDQEPKAIHLQPFYEFEIEAGLRTFEILSQRGMGETGFSLPLLQLKSAWEESHSSRKKHNHAKVWFGAIVDNKRQNAAPSPDTGWGGWWWKEVFSVVSPLEQDISS